MKVKLFRCLVCGDPYVGEEPPQNCPFCGAPRNYIVPAEKYNVQELVQNISQKSRENVEAAIQLEKSNAEFYNCAKNCEADHYGKQLFRALAKVEAEHAALLSKAIGKDAPEIDKDCKAGKCLGSYRLNLEEAHRREDNAIKHYSQFLAEATEPRLKQVFKALVEIETTHLEIEQEQLDR